MPFTEKSQCTLQYAIFPSLPRPFPGFSIFIVSQAAVEKSGYCFLGFVDTGWSFQNIVATITSTHSISKNIFKRCLTCLINFRGLVRCTIGDMEAKAQKVSMPHRAEILLLPILLVFPKENQGHRDGELESTHGLKPADRSFKCPFTPNPQGLSPPTTNKTSSCTRLPKARLYFKEPPAGSGLRLASMKSNL